MRRNLGYLVLGVAIFLLGGWLSYQWARPAENVRQTEATVLLERVREVCKLVTVEGDFTEIYNESNMREVTLYLPIPVNWSFSKRAMLEVQGKVLVGYDMERMSITVDSLNQRITLRNLPQPSILAIDHEIRYRDLEESFFNSFSPEDYTQLNSNAKAILKERALESDLLDRAREQGNQMLNTIRFMGESLGYEVILEEALSEPSRPNID